MAGLNEWLDANTVNAEPFEVEVAGHVFHFRRVRSVSERNRISKRGLDLVEIVNSGRVDQWRNYGPIDAQIGYVLALLSDTNIDTGSDKLSDSLLIKMQSEAGPIFNKLGEAYLEASGFTQDWVTEQVEEAKND